MKKLFYHAFSFLNQLKSMSLFTIFILLSVVTSAQSVNPITAQSQLDPKTHYPLIFLNPQAATTQHSDQLQWETLQTIVVPQRDPNSPLPPTKFNLDQVRNGKGSAPEDPAGWVNGNAGASNAHYVEGWSIPYRVSITDLALGAHSLDIEWDIRHSGANAIDFVTNYDMINYPASSHLFNFGHGPETVNPLTEAGSWASGTSSVLPAPSLPAGAVTTYYNQVMTYSNASGDANKFSIWNGDITNMVLLTEGSLASQQSSTRMRIFFTNTAENVVIAWGGHIAKGDGVWGTGNSASAVSGSPYHTRLISWDPDGDGNNQTSIGNQDRSLSAAAVQDPPICNLTGPGSLECSATSTFSSGVAQSDLSQGVSFDWEIEGATNCGTISLTNESVSSASVTTSSSCGCSFSVVFIILKNGEEISRCVKLVTVTDTQAPSITCPAAPTSPINCPATPSFGTATASDNCGSATLTSADVTTPGSCAGNYTVTRKWTARDACGNTSTCSRSVVVQDLTPPVISGVAGPSTIDCPAEPTFSSPTASDACTNSTASLAFTDATNTSCGNARSVTRKWTATDDCGNTSTASQTITVRDITPPVISGVGGPSTIDCPAEPTFSSPTASDACTNSTASLAFTDATNTSCGNARTVTRKWTATDACGNTSTASQTITVRDNTPPTITCPPNIVVECDVNVATANLGTATASDACGPTTVTSSDGPPVAKACITVITRKWVARDACGNTSTCSQIITKRDNTGPVINCTNGTATDNCSPTGDIIIYQNNGTWTAIDGSGNITTATANCSVQGAARAATSQVTGEQLEQQQVTEEKKVTEEKTKAIVRAKPGVQDVSVQAIPNPFNDRVKFVVTSPQAGYGTLEVMNMLGQKVKTVYQGQIQAGGQSFEMSLPSGRFTSLFYILRINGKQITGKLIQAGTRN